MPNDNVGEDYGLVRILYKDVPIYFFEYFNVNPIAAGDGDKRQLEAVYNLVKARLGTEEISRESASRELNKISTQLGIQQSPAKLGRMHDWLVLNKNIADTHKG